MSDVISRKAVLDILSTARSAVAALPHSAPAPVVPPHPPPAGEGVTVRTLLQILQGQSEDTLNRRLYGDDGKPVMSLSVMVRGTDGAHVVWNTNAGE